jgi:hypothetical protein
MDFIWTVVVTWAAAVSIAVLSAIGISLGFRMGRLTKGEQATLFPEFRSNLPACEDEPGGTFEDHMAGGKYDEFKHADEIERMKTL